MASMSLNPTGNSQRPPHRRSFWLQHLSQGLPSLLHSPLGSRTLSPLVSSFLPSRPQVSTHTAVLGPLLGVLSLSPVLTAAFSPRSSRFVDLNAHLTYYLGA